MDRRDNRELGDHFENWISVELDIPKVIGSGSGKWHKLDVKGTEIIISGKATQNKSFSVKRDDLDEVTDATSGPGGLGLSHTGMLLLGLYPPGEAITPPDEVYAIIRLSDLLHLDLSNRDSGPSAKADEKRRQAQVPSLLKE
jgi:hypothetical protein